MLDRSDVELLLVVMRFLKKLSIFEENKNEMNDLDIIQKLNRFLPHPNEVRNRNSFISPFVFS